MDEWALNVRNLELGSGEAAGVKIAYGVEQVIERRPPRPVLQRPEGFDDASRSSGRVGDANPRHGDSLRAHGSQRTQINVGGGGVGALRSCD